MGFSVRAGALGAGPAPDRLGEHDAAAGGLLHLEHRAHAGADHVPQLTRMVRRRATLVSTSVGVRAAERELPIGVRTLSGGTLRSGSSSSGVCPGGRGEVGLRK